MKIGPVTLESLWPRLPAASCKGRVPAPVLASTINPARAARWLTTLLPLASTACNDTEVTYGMVGAFTSVCVIGACLVYGMFNEMRRWELVYEVTLTVDRETSDAFHAWLVEHIQEMLDIDGFEAARVFEQEGEIPEGKRVWVVSYAMRDRQALESYFRDRATDMREKGERNFGGRFTASRRVLSSPIDSLTKPSHYFEPRSTPNSPPA